MKPSWSSPRGRLRAVKPSWPSPRGRPRGGPSLAARVNASATSTSRSGQPRMLRRRRVDCEAGTVPNILVWCLKAISCLWRKKERSKKFAKKTKMGVVYRESRASVSPGPETPRVEGSSRSAKPVDPAGSEGGPRRRAALPRTTDTRDPRRSSPVGKSVSRQLDLRVEVRGTWPQPDPATVQARGESLPHGPGRPAPAPSPSEPRPRLSPCPRPLVEVSSHVRPIRATRGGGDDATLSDAPVESPIGPRGPRPAYRRGSAQGSQSERDD